MAFNVRIYGFRGVEQIPIVHPKQYSADSIYQLAQPYEFSQVILVGAVAVSSAADAGTQTKLLRVEVPDGQTVRFEINPSGRNVAASTNSQSLSGKDQFFFAPGWTISLIDASGLP